MGEIKIEDDVTVIYSANSKIIKKGYYNWIVQPIAYCATSFLLIILSFWLFNPTDEIGIIIQFLFVGLLFYCMGFFTLKAAIINFIFRDLLGLEKQLKWLGDNPLSRPTSKMNSSIIDLRSQLLAYAKGTTAIFPLESYYSSQLQRKIDTFFTLVFEGLYGTYFEGLRKNNFQQNKDELKSFYVKLDEWNKHLSNHLFINRSWKESSNGQLATLGSFFESSIFSFDGKYGINLVQVKEDVKAFYDRQEEVAKTRWASIVNIASLLIVALFSSLFSALLVSTLP